MTKDNMTVMRQRSASAKSIYKVHVQGTKDRVLFGHVLLWETQASKEMKKDKDLCKENVVKIMRDHEHTVSQETFMFSIHSLMLTPDSNASTQIS